MQSGSAREAELGRYDTAELSFTLSHLRADVAHKAEQLQQRMADADMLRARAQAAGGDAWAWCLDSACCSWQPRKLNNKADPISSSVSRASRCSLANVLEQLAVLVPSHPTTPVMLPALSINMAPHQEAPVPHSEADPAGALAPSTPECAPDTTPGASPARRSILEKLGVRRETPAVVTTWGDEGQEPGVLVAPMIEGT